MTHLGSKGGLFVQTPLKSLERQDLFFCTKFVRESLCDEGADADVSVIIHPLIYAMKCIS